MGQTKSCRHTHSDHTHDPHNITLKPLPDLTPSLKHRLQTLGSDKNNPHDNAQQALLTFYQSTPDIRSFLTDLKELTKLAGRYHSIFESTSQDPWRPLVNWSDEQKLSSQDCEKFIAQLCGQVWPCLSEASTSIGSLANSMSSSLTSNKSGDVKSKILTDEDLFMLAMASPPLMMSISDKRRADLLFSLDQFGHSWIRFVDQCNAYPSTIVLAVRSSEGEVFGAVIFGGLEESGTKFTGNSLTFLYGLAPRFQICRSTGRDDKYVLLNRQSAFVPTGLAFGGQDGAYRFRLHSDLKKATAVYQDSTYQIGSIFPMLDSQDGSQLFEKSVDIDRIEVWGIGSQTDLEEQKYAKLREEDMKADRRQVDLGRLLEGGDDFFIKKVEGGGRQGEVDAIIEERRRVKEELRR